MNLETTFVTSGVPVTVLTTHGEIDGSNYRQLISAVEKLYQEGTRNLVLDLGDTAFISSSGLVALHSVALLLNGNKPLNVEEGWTALHSMSEGPRTLQEHLKLLNVQARVDRTLTVSGLKPFYAIFTDLKEALAAFPEKGKG